MAACIWARSELLEVVGTEIKSSLLYGFHYFQVITRESCTPKADVWSIGVITYILLVGYPPFYVPETSCEAEEGKNEAVLLKKIVNGEYEFLEESWQEISPEAIDFIRSLMCQNPDERPTCDEALDHPWLNDRKNLENRAAEKNRRKDSLLTDLETPLWTQGQKLAFILSLLVILGSYSAMITYVFSIGKPNLLIMDFVSNLKLEFMKVYTTVYEFIDNWTDFGYRLLQEAVNYLCPFEKSICPLPNLLFPSV